MQKEAIQLEVHGTPNPKVNPSPIDPTKNESNPRFKSDIDRANIFSLLYFGYVFRLVISGFKATRQGKSISGKDLITFPWSRRADVLSDRFTNLLNKQKRENPKKKLNLSKAILWTVKWPLFKIIVLETLFIFVRILSAWIIKKLIDCYTDKNLAPMAWKWAGILSACLLGAFHLEHHFNHLASVFPNHIQNALVNLIFEKITKLSTDALTKISSGKLLNLCTNGVNIFEQLGMYVANIFVGIFALIAGGALLWQYFGVFCLISIGYIVFWYPWQQLFIVLSLKERDRTNAASANRIRMTTETIEAIRLLKMYTWELNFKEKISALRNVEMNMLKTSSISNSLIRGLSFSTQVCSTFLMFMAYKVSGHTLEAGAVFSAYFVIGYLRLYASYMFGLALNFLTDARILIRNIEQVLETPEIGEIKFQPPTDQKNAIEFENFNANWNKEEKATSATKSYTLTDVNLRIKKGSLNALVGAVGSGKTSLMMTLTGEMPETTGSLKYNGTIAIVEQEPTIFAGTFRENVCFGKPYEPEFYKKVVKACNLESDLKLFPQGDLSEIGEKGNNLSGGQKARLALCRAVYSQADIYLLDDPLSAVDPKVARSIYGNAIEKVLHGKTVLLTTHQVDFARSCENIVIMEDGRVLGSGTYEELKQQGVDVDKVFGNKNSRAVEEQEEAKPVETKKPDEEKEDNDAQEGADDKQVKKDQYAVTVTWRNYLGLAKEMGGPFFFIVVLATLITCEMCNMGYGRMLGALISGTFEDWISYTILACFVGYDIFIYIAKYQVLGWGLIRAAERYHNKMLDRIIKGTVYFFDTNPIGQIISRFSNDVGILDKYIPLGIMDTINASVAISAILITAAIINPILIAPMAGAVIAIIILFWLIFPSVKQSKLYEIKSKGPLFGLLSATLSGIVAIRIYKQADVFQQKFKDLLNTTMKANSAFTHTSRFMAFYMDLVYNIAAIGCVFIVTAKAQGSSVEEGGLAAFALALILIINALFQFGLKQFSQLNISMAAVARVQAYLEAPNEPPLSRPSDKPLKDQQWPQKGEIDFNRVYMKYKPDGDHVIRDLSLHVEPGQKIGCVGRTGAGKSSIIQLLYRMQELDRTGEFSKESFIKMDNANTQEVGLHLLRDNISIIPQIPFIFTGTIRSNVDPLGQFNDDQIWAALEDVRLKHHVERQTLKLDTHIHGGTSVFSAGQKQLVCLARAILKKSNVLIMDEATANMDYDTDFFVQKKIEERFAKSTQFTIAHRLQTIANYDKVLVLDRGRKMEFDEPYKLLVKNIGDKEATNAEGHFAGMVYNTGPISSKKIFEIAHDAYFNRHPEQKH